MRNKKRSILLTGVLIAALLLSVSALAINARDPAQPVSLTVLCAKDETPLVGAAFDLYLVASLDESGNLQTAEAFAGYPVSLVTDSDEALRAAAMALEGYALRDSIAPTQSGSTDAAGRLTFSDALAQGMYLVVGRYFAQDGVAYTFAPVLVTLPSLVSEQDGYAYDVLIRAKYTDEPITDAPVTRKVLKVWSDDSAAPRPQSVTVQLLCDGSVYDTVTLSDQNNWIHVWTDLEPGHKWTVAETVPSGYTVSVDREEITFVVTNTRTPTPAPTPTPSPTPSRLPQTGQLWWPIPVLLCAGLVCVILGALRRKARDDEA